MSSDTVTKTPCRISDERERGIAPTSSDLAFFALATTSREFVGIPFTRGNMSPCFTHEKKTWGHLLPRHIAELPAIHTTLSLCIALASQAKKKVRKQQRVRQRIDPLVT